MSAYTEFFLSSFGDVTISQSNSDESRHYAIVDEDGNVRFDRPDDDTPENRQELTDWIESVLTGELPSSRYAPRDSFAGYFLACNIEPPFSADGVLHNNEEEAHERNVELCETELDKIDEWIQDYVGSDDYADDYAYLAYEDATYRHLDRLIDWIEENVEIDEDIDVKALADKVLDRIVYYNLIECELSRSVYAAYCGDGFEMDSFTLEEYENQVDVNEVELFSRLHAQGKLRDVLKDVNCNVYISDSMVDLREPHPCFYTYHNPSVRWHFVVSKESIDEIINELLEEMEQEQEENELSA